jgi:hypothetical protein
MQITDKRYSEHSIFEDLKYYAEFYKSLSFSTMSFIPIGTGALNFDTYIFSSMQGTLESISSILSAGRINDSYALLRKYHDSAIINAYEIAYLADHVSIENFIVQKISDWLKGNEKIPGYNPMKQYLQKNPKLISICALFKSDDRYPKIRSRCNDHMHYNYFHYMLANDNEVYNKSRLTLLNQLSEDLRDIFILHIGYLFSLNPHYMVSSDYLDALECGLTPEEGSQYFVAPFIQKIFDTVIKPYRADIAKLIRNESGMTLE